jgi:hypothetical protein
VWDNGTTTVGLTGTGFAPTVLSTTRTYVDVASGVTSTNFALAAHEVTADGTIASVGLSFTAPPTGSLSVQLFLNGVANGASCTIAAATSCAAVVGVPVVVGDQVAIGVRRSTGSETLTPAQSSATEVVEASAALVAGPHLVASYTKFTDTTEAVVALGTGAEFTSATTYVCTVTDADQPGVGFSVTNTSGSSFTIAAPTSNSDRVNYVCVGR